MPESKKQPARIRIINSCLCRKGKYWTKQELISEMAESDLIISERTLEQDIRDMRICGQLQYYAPIKYCKVNKGYYYTDPYYSIDKLPLNEMDIKALELAATTLNQYKYIPLMNEYTVVIDKIISVVNRVKRRNFESIFDFIIFEKTPVAVGMHHMDAIIGAIQNKSAILLTYRKFNSPTASTFIIHPYLIKEYRNRWYVVGLNENKETLRTYAFDRIDAVSLSDIPYKPNTTINTDDYFKNCIGINQMSGKVERVLLEFTTLEGKYIKTQSLHSSQQLIEDSGERVVIALEVIINFELIGIILGYGSNVKVLEPDHLALKIIEIANKIINQYS